MIYGIINDVGINRASIALVKKSPIKRATEIARSVELVTGVYFSPSAGRNCALPFASCKDLFVTLRSLIISYYVYVKFLVAGIKLPSLDYKERAQK